MNNELKDASMDRDFLDEHGEMVSAVVDMKIIDKLCKMNNKYTYI